MSGPQIVSASRRTDIPAFFTDWFRRRMDEGYCLVPNPYRPSQMRRVELDPGHVAGFVFWTRDARPMFPLMEPLAARGYAFYFLVTVCGYPPGWEPRAPRDGAESLVELASHVGRERVIWRYDPVILSRRIGPRWHAEQFARLCDRIAGHAAKLVVSVVDPYRKTRRAMARDDDPVVYDPAAYSDVLGAIAERAAQAHLAVQSCAEPALGVAGITPGPCVDAERLAALGGRGATATAHPTRPGCLCARSVDIGVNGTCCFGCRYCYAATGSRPLTSVNPAVCPNRADE